MRLVVVQETDWLKRGPHQQHHLFERLSERGHEIIVLDYPILRPHWPHEPFWVETYRQANAARLYPDAKIDLITPGTFSFAPLARPSSVWTHHQMLAQIIQEARPDVIVSYALSTGLSALRLARRYRIPYVFHVIDALHEIVPVRALQPVAHAVERRLFSSADEVLVINEHLRDYALAMGANPSRAHVLRTGVDLQRFRPEQDGTETRVELGLSPDDYVLFFMGWIYPFSGVREVAETLRNAPENVRFLVVGDGDDYSHLRSMQAEGLQDRLVLTGRVSYDIIPRLMAAADVCLLPFHLTPVTEHIVPIKLYEYMAGGKPVIASPLPGVQRDVGEANGVVYAPATEQLAKALEIRAQRESLGGAARAFVEAYCDWSTITEELEQRLMALAQRVS